jgi:NADPH:quinone reductase-like Zn-dependent oxidoreductase
MNCTLTHTLVTGASTGIGRATSLRLAAAGQHVYAGVRQEAHGEQLVRAAADGEVTPLLLDVTQAGQIAEAAVVIGRHTPAGLEDAADQADLVFDAAGGEVLAQSASIVKPGGALISVAAFPPFGRGDAREMFFIQEQNRVQLTELARLVDEGHLRPQVGAVYSLVEAAQAYRAKAAGGIPGRVVLQP